MVTEVIEVVEHGMVRGTEVWAPCGGGIGRQRGGRGHHGHRN